MIEMLVVVAIISILSGLVMVGLQKGRKTADINVARTDIQTIVSRVKGFAAAFGDFPPSSLADIKVKGNGINDGNESLFAFLLTRKKGGPFADDLKEDHWKNADDDELNVLVDRKVPRNERDRVPIVTDQAGQIVWVAGHVLAEPFRVTPLTKSVVVLTLRRQ